jgi:hypothetical protein
MSLLAASPYDATCFVPDTALTFPFAVVVMYMSGKKLPAWAPVDDPPTECP